MLGIMDELQTIFGFNSEDARIIAIDIFCEDMEKNPNDLKREIFRYAERLRNGGF